MIGEYSAPYQKRVLSQKAFAIGRRINCTMEVVVETFDDEETYYLTLDGMREASGDFDHIETFLYGMDLAIKRISSMLQG